MNSGLSSFEDVEGAERAFYRKFLRAGMVVVDAGAHVGDLTLMFARLVELTGTVHAFEPAPQTFERLESSCRAAGLSNVRLNAVALAEHTGQIDFNVYQAEYWAWNTRAVRPLAKYGIDIAAPIVMSVPCLTLDQYCEDNGVRHVDMLKIDVEGAELDVLVGADRLLREQRIRLVTFEFGQTTFDMGHTPDEIIAYFHRHNYQVRNLIETDPAFPGGHSVETATFSMHVAQPTHRQ